MELMIRDKLGNVNTPFILDLYDVSPEIPKLIWDNSISEEAITRFSLKSDWDSAFLNTLPLDKQLRIITCLQQNFDKLAGSLGPRDIYRLTEHNPYIAVECFHQLSNSSRITE